jgi:TPR repeat protein
MWKSIKNLFKIIPKQTPPSPSSSVILPITAASKLQAQLEFRQVLKELGAGNHIKTSIKTNALISEYKGKDVDVDSVNGEQLEEIARAYFDGTDDGYQQNLEKAFELWSSGAAKGHVGSMYSMAACLREGKGTTKDANRAFQLLYELAHTHNYMLGHFALGVMYSAGEGTEVNDEKAFAHFLSAAQLGVVPACYYVAQSYASGKGIQQSDGNALKYYEAGALVGDPASKCKVLLNTCRV